jgi:2-iminobutanoate/2-iminopropanoate deaminase
MKASVLVAGIVLLAGSIGSVYAAQYLTGDFPKSRGYSPAVITKGGRTVWLAGEGGTKDAAGNDISNNLEAQTKLAFDNISETLKRAGGSLENVVKMTVFIKNQEDGNKFVAQRKSFFPSGNYPASSLITIKDLALAGMVIEIEAVAVIDEN